MMAVHMTGVMVTISMTAGAPPPKALNLHHLVFYVSITCVKNHRLCPAHEVQLAYLVHRRSKGHPRLCSRGQ